MLLHLKGSHRFISLMLCALLLAGCGHQRMPEKPVSPVGKEEPVRGVWLTTVLRLDWPSLSSINASSDSIRISTQKKELTDTLDDLVKNGVNTLFFQVKPDGSALYHSAILPWSDVLTGVTGKDPGYDPLAFAVSEAHKRGLKIHAWLNPYRVSMDTRPETSASLERTLSSSPASVYALHKDWI
ncbi:glycoside hydrolase family 10 protein, partial [Yersinia pestis]